MTWRWHLFGGLIAYGIGLLGWSYLGTISLLETGPLFAITLFGALFPDIDTSSKARRLIYTKWLVLLFAILVLFNTNTLLLIIIFGCALLPFFVRHRGLFHNVFFLATLAFMPALVGSHYFSEHNSLIYICACFFFLGTFSHLILDKI